MTIGAVPPGPLGREVAEHATYALQRVLALLLLVLGAPVLLAVALLVGLTSRGPVVYRQTRVGRFGRHFTILKFRTMRAGADHELLALLALQGRTVTPFVKLDHDPRVTAVGRWLRRLSIDELPQLWNVVRGDMALVGPRPQTPQEVATYDDTTWRRLLARPGVTGLWQVSGRSDLSPTEGLALDDEYVRSWSPLLDARVLLRTAAVLVTQRGAR
ncbi:sugar transferase [Nocardioides sp. SOB77]|uniref:Sugar transferase n=1 Tax=Nocardioides oceani TaxID=3058369 RepID=A0ABT8FGN1_9ACTN|nr:sugar transferase [Nocardioides oceani]MDN4173615.1 sugar transferase [Nocardioides oceani]